MEEFNGSQFCSDHIIIELKFELEYKGKKPQISIKIKKTLQRMTRKSFASVQLG